MRKWTINLFFKNQLNKKEKYFWKNSYEYSFRWGWSWHVLSRFLFLTQNANCPIKFHGMCPTKSEVVDSLFWLAGFAVQNRIPTDSASVISRRYTQFTFDSPPTSFSITLNPPFLSSSFLFPLSRWFWFYKKRSARIKDLVSPAGWSVDLMTCQPLFNIECLNEAPSVYQTYFLAIWCNGITGHPHKLWHYR